MALGLFFWGHFWPQFWAFLPFVCWALFIDLGNVSPIISLIMISRLLTFSIHLGSVLFSLDNLALFLGLSLFFPPWKMESCWLKAVLLTWKLLFAFLALLDSFFSAFIILFSTHGMAWGPGPLPSVVPDQLLGVFTCVYTVCECVGRLYFR